MKRYPYQNKTGEKNTKPTIEIKDISITPDLTRCKKEIFFGIIFPLSVCVSPRESVTMASDQRNREEEERKRENREVQVANC